LDLGDPFVYENGDLMILVFKNVYTYLTVSLSLVFNEMKILFEIVIDRWKIWLCI